MSNCYRTLGLFSVVTLTLFAGAIFGFPTAWRELAGRFRHDPELNYLVVIPLIFACLIWVRRDQLERWSIQRAWVGLFIIVLAIAGARVVTSDYVELFWFGSAAMGLLGAIVALMGVKVFSAWGPALILLVLFVPLSTDLRRSISVPLEQATAVISAEILRLVGLEVQRLGSLVTVGGHPVNVAEACGGTRMIMTVGLAVYAYVFLNYLRPWVRWSVLAMTPMIALIANIGRVIPSVMMYGLVDDKWASIFHDTMAWGMMAVAYLACIGIVAGLAWLGFAPRLNALNQKSLKHSANGAWPRLGWPAFGAVVLLFGSAMTQFEPELTGEVGRYHAEVASQVSQLSPPDDSWVGKEVSIPAAAINMLRPNAVAQVRYENPQTTEAFSFALSHCGQVRDLRNHHPPVCYSAVGWNVGLLMERTWVIGDFVVKGNAYKMYRFLDGRGEQITVCNTFLLPGLGATRQHNDLLPLERHRVSNMRGAAELQWVFDVRFGQEDQDKMIRDFLSSNEELIGLLSTGPSDDR